MNSYDFRNNQKTRVLVLKKTKLSEYDLIITCLKQDGSLLRAIAKSARKPSSTFSSRLDLFCECDILIAKGKNLDIIREAKLINSYKKIRGNINKLSAVYPALELLANACQPDLEQNNIYPLTIKFLEQISETNELHDTYLKALLCAHLIKASSLMGFKPSFDQCVICGQSTKSLIGNFDLLVPFSLNNGGVICTHCSKDSTNNTITSNTLSVLRNLLNKTFSDIVLFMISDKQINEAMKFCYKWILYCLGIKLKSLQLYLNMHTGYEDKF